MSNISDHLIFTRESKGLSQVEVAKAIGLSHRNYQRYEAGFFPKFRSEKVRALDKLLGTHIYDILYDMKTPPEEQTFLDVIKAKEQSLIRSPGNTGKNDDVQEKYMALMEKVIKDQDANSKSILHYLRLSQARMVTIFQHFAKHRSQTESLPLLDIQVEMNKDLDDNLKDILKRDN